MVINHLRSGKVHGMACFQSTKPKGYPFCYNASSIFFSSSTRSTQEGDSALALVIRELPWFCDLRIYERSIDTFATQWETRKVYLSFGIESLHSDATWQRHDVTSWLKIFMNRNHFVYITDISHMFWWGIATLHSSHTWWSPSRTLWFPVNHKLRYMG